MKSRKTITTISKQTDFGYDNEFEFVKEVHEQGGIEYYVFGWERWEDGHRTKMPNNEFLRTNREYGNNLFKRRIAEGYVIKNRRSFETTEMDNR